jgi:hypothetical protein
MTSTSITAFDRLLQLTVSHHKSGPSGDINRPQDPLLFIFMFLSREME